MCLWKHLLQLYVGHVSSEQLFVGFLPRKGDSFLMCLSLLHCCLGLMVLCMHVGRKKLWFALLSLPFLMSFQDGIVSHQRHLQVDVG